MPSETPTQQERAAAEAAKSATRAPISHRLTRLFVRASFVGLLTSVAVHVALAIVATGIVVAVVGSGSDSGVVSADAGLMTLTESELEALEEQSLAPASSPDEAIKELTARTEEIPTAPDLTGEPMPTTESGPGVVGQGGAGDMTGVGEGGAGSGAGGAGGGGARFFGVEAVGNRFAYIVDVSGSMAGPKLAALQEELERSLDGLTERSQYHIVLFSSESRPLGGRSKWSDASIKNKKQTFQQIRAIAAGGATNPAPAFEDVFSLRPRPEAIYFMTDGLFNPEVAAMVRQQNTAGGVIVPIHCIAFVSQDAEDIMRRIASDSDGTYTFVPGPGIIQ